MIELKFKRIKIKKRYRILISIILTIIVIIPIIFAIHYISTNPKTKTENIIICQNYQKGIYNYTAYLKENEIYNNKTILKKGEGLIFKDITNYLEMSFLYEFFSDCGKVIDATYQLDLKLYTNSWSKEYNIFQQSKFAPENFNVSFEINISQYQDYINKIEDEIKIILPDTKLNIISTIHIILETDEGIITEIFKPTISIPMKDKIINFEGNLSQFSLKNIENTIEVPIPIEEINNEIYNYLIIAGILFIPFILFIITTKNELYIYKTDKSQIKIQKILKKYKEWIVEVEKPVKELTTSDIVYCKTMDDLMKISEQLGKPVLHVQQDKNKHIFYISENSKCYRFIIKK